MTFGLLWDDKHLYVGARVEDGRLVNDRSTRNNVWAVQVVDAEGAVIYESEPTPDGRFDVEHPLTNAGSLKGGRILMRPRDHSVERDARRFKWSTLALIGLIDLMLVGGLLLVHANVRRQMGLARLKSDFVANVSHELKTPVSLIHLYAETLESGRCPTEERKQHYYQVINKESLRLSALIDNILDFARIEAGRKQYTFAPTELGPLVREVIEVYRAELEEQGFVVEAAIDETVPAVSADRAALWQSIINLVSNAQKYSREEKYVRLELRRDGSQARISVEDHGVGVAESHQVRIFEKFYRAEDSLVHETKGSGLGLALVAEIIRSHKGHVEVESTPGRGSKFTLVLPLAEEAHESPADHRGRAGHGGGAEGQLRA
jgi:signal transduction histidine kinase